MRFSKKNSAIALVLTVLASLPSLSLAITNCDNQPKPAFDCPPGYSMSCNPVGGDHWSCSKPALGQVGAPEPALTGAATTNASASSGYVDDRFKPVGVIPDAVIEQQEAAKKLSISIDGATLRSEVALGTVTVKGWDPKKWKITTDPDQIRTREDLESYAQAIVLNDPNISQLSIQEQSIVIKYRTVGRFLGFLPVRITSSVEVTVGATNPDGTTAGTIILKFPWYHFLIQKNISARSVASEFAAQLQILHSVDDIQKVAQYLAIISSVLKKT